MSITKVLADKEMSDEQKLALVAEVVEQAREAYGNADLEVESVDVNTTDGMMGFEYLTAESKVYILSREAQSIRAQAVEYARNVQGVVLSKKVDEIVATNPLFCNIGSSADLGCI
jgi:hypothetical protein